MNLKDIQKLQKIAQGGKRAKTTADDLEVMARLEGLGQAPLMYTAADRARAGNKAAELIKSQPQVKASEALGQSMEKGIKKVSTTQSDRTRVGGGNIGGANFPAISEADPEYARKVWGVMDEGTAKRLTNLSDPETAWTTMLGSATQLKTNPVVFDKLKKQFIAAMKEGKLSKELEAKINHNLELTFGEGAQIRDPNIWKEANTFEKRAALADLMMGQGIQPSKGGVALGGEKSGKGVIFKPTDTIIEETEPSLLHPEHGGNAETFALGPRLFKLSGTAEQRPDLHPGFPTLLHGEDLGHNFAPVPTGVFLPDWHANFKKKKPDQTAGYYHLALGLKGEGLPSQELNDAYIRHLIREGYAEGGAVKMANGSGVTAPRKYVPPSQLFPLKTEPENKSALQNIGNAVKDESTTYGDKGATMDIINRGPVADALGSFVDLANMPLQGLDYLASKIPAFSKPASVMEPEGERVPIARVSTDEPYGGSEAWKKQFQKSGITSMTERPLAEMALSLASPLAPFAASKALKVGKALAPTAGKLAQEFAESTQFGMPLQMNVVPPAEGVAQVAGKAAEVKAPANDLGMYSVVEKAALNLQRKSGNGDAFLSDLMKNQGVSQAKLDETGLTATLKGRTGVTRDEVQKLATEGKVPLRESIRRDEDRSDTIQSLKDNTRFLEGSIENIKRDLLNEPNHPWNDSRREKIKQLKEGIEQNKQKIQDIQPALFRPSVHPEYSTNGGKNYREIRIKTPTEENVDPFYQTSHHGDEPNVLLHMRVADHVDADGKKGLLIDELQSDWHQMGRDRGYKTRADMPQMSADELFDRHFEDLTASQRTYLRDYMKKWESAEYNGKQDQLDKLTNEYQNWISKQTLKGIPDAPFKDDWYQLGLKRAIKEAVEAGKDRVYLTTGQTQAKRYDLSQHINDLGYKPDGKGSGRLQAFDKNRITVLDQDIPEEKLADYIGKEAAKKLLESEKVMGTHSLSNTDLQIGGEGMKQWYDKTYLNWLKKYAKQHGAEVGMTRLNGTAKTRADLSAKQMHDMEKIPEFKKILDEEFAKMDTNNPSMYKPWDAALKRFGGDPVYYIDLNPKLKNTAKKGQAFAEGGAVQSPNGFDYESHVNKLMDAHNLSNFDYEGHVNKIMGMAEGGAAYNTSPDMSDGGLSIQAPAFKIGGRIPLLTR